MKKQVVHWEKILTRCISGKILVSRISMKKPSNLVRTQASQFLSCAKDLNRLHKDRIFQWLVNMEVKMLLIQSCPTLRPWGPQPTRFLGPWTSSGKKTGVGSHSFLLGIIPTQGSNPSILQCRQLLHCLSHQGILHDARYH